MDHSNRFLNALNKQSIELPKQLTDLKQINFEASKKSAQHADIEKLFPHLKNLPFLEAKKNPTSCKPLNVGVVFSGGQAPGGHNVLWGLWEGLKQLNTHSKLIGFLNGPKGFLDQNAITLDDQTISPYRNIGGFHLIGSGRDKIEKDEDFHKALQSAIQFKLDAFVIIGGDDSNTNVALLAEFFKSQNHNTAVIGVPKTIDGDLKNAHVELSFGFDTAASLYSELIGNLLLDTLSSKKYYHFVKLMGRAASHLTLECALRCQPNLALIAEEVNEKKKSLNEIIEDITDLILSRSKEGKNYGVILIPEGLIDFIPEFHLLNDEISQKEIQSLQDLHKLSTPSEKLFESLPLDLQKQLLSERDPHGNLPLSKIETGKFLVQSIQKKLAEREKIPFKPLTHFFGYEGRCSHPSPFDAKYCYALGQCAALLAMGGHCGYMACIKNLSKEDHEWSYFGLPIQSLLNLENRHGKMKPVIKKALVQLQGSAFKTYSNKRAHLRLHDEYISPGPIQLFDHQESNPPLNFLLQTACFDD